MYSYPIFDSNQQHILHLYHDACYDYTIGTFPSTNPCVFNFPYLIHAHVRPPLHDWKPYYSAHLIPQQPPRSKSIPSFFPAPLFSICVRGPSGEEHFPLYILTLLRSPVLSDSGTAANAFRLILYKPPNLRRRPSAHVSIMHIITPSLDIISLLITFLYVPFACSFMAGFSGWIIIDEVQ